MINKQRLIKTFLDLVKIDSPSGEEEAMAKEMVKKLKALGGKVERDSFGNVIAKFPGQGEPMMLNSHLDTVEPGRAIKPIIKGDIIKSDGTTILGADAKAGVAAILEAITSLKEGDKPHVPLEIVFTLGEEIGLLGAINLDYSKISSKRGLTFDGGEQPHKIHISAPGYNRVDVTIIGRSAHAGQEPEKGLSAIKIASEIITKLKLGRIDFETTANIGLIEGGSARNAVPEKVHFKGEIRSRNMKKLEHHTNHFRKTFDQILSRYPEAQVDLVLHREFDSYLFTEDHSVIQHIKQVCRRLRIKPIFVHSGGGTDVNIFHTHGIEVVAVGTGDYNAHTTREYVKILEMHQAAKFCEQLVDNNLNLR